MTAPDSASASPFADLPPSARYVYHVIREADGQALTRQQLIDRTTMPASTVDDALDTLESRDCLLRSRASQDARQVVCEIREPRRG